MAQHFVICHVAVGDSRRGDGRPTISLGRSVFRWMCWLGALLLAAATLLPVSASAQRAAVTTQPANMRAGPDRNFPLVAWLPAGAGVTVMGCVDGWRWCDVVWGFNRGWIFARFLAMTWQNQPTMIFGGGPGLGIP